MFPTSRASRPASPGLLPSFVKAVVPGAALIVLAGCLAGCATPAQTAGLGIAGATLLGASIPSSDIEQIYYLGVFDPAEQLPPQMYRVRIRGQASVLSNTRFASGWAPAQLVDSLTGHISVDPDSNSAVSTSSPSGNASTLQVGRRLVLFGPEGFREAPRDNRLVIVMGSSPDKYFEAIDRTLGDVQAIRMGSGDKEAQDQLMAEYIRLTQRKGGVNQLKDDLDRLGQTTVLPKQSN